MVHETTGGTFYLTDYRQWRFRWPAFLIWRIGHEQLNPRTSSVAYGLGS